MRGIIERLWILIEATRVVVVGGNVRIKVNGLLNRSIGLSLPVNQSSSIQEIFWTFNNRMLANYRDLTLDVIMDQFAGRLESRHEGRSLSIGQLRPEDSGPYTATARFSDRTQREVFYDVMVYEPVPAPKITLGNWTQTGDQCNVTLFCSVPINSPSLSYTWKYRQKDLDYQLYDNSTGDTVQMSLQNGFSDVGFLCIVYNPADQKNVSFHVRHACREEIQTVGSSARTHVITGAIIIVVVLILVIGALALVIARKWTKKEDPPAEDKRREPQREPQYIQVTTSSSDGANEVWNNSLYKASQQKPKAITVYAEIKHPHGAHG